MRRNTFKRGSSGNAVTMIMAALVAAFVLAVSATTAAGYPFDETATLVSSSGTTNERFGAAVAISGDGNTVAVGAPGFEDGTDIDSVQVFVRGTGDTWNRQATLTHPNASVGNQFGSAVALSQDGSRLVVGSPRSYSAVTYTRTGTVWNVTTEFKSIFDNTRFGESVAMTPAGDRIIIGAPRNPGGANQGRASVLSFQSGTFQTVGYPTLGNQDTYTNRLFGESVALTSTGTKAFVGAPGNASTSATLREFNEGSFNWTANNVWSFLFYSDSQTGAAIDLAANDAAGVIGAPGVSSGRGAIVPMRNSGTYWSLHSSVADDPIGHNPGDALGTSVASSDNGAVLLAGAPGANSSQGSVHAYTRVASFARTDWFSGEVDGDTDGLPGDRFGEAVAISDDGETAVVGAPGADRSSITDRGAAFILQDTNYTLTVNKTGTGQITSSPSGINCGDTCTGTFDENQTVTLTAMPASDQVFTGWGGSCSGTGICQVTMNSNKTVQATFANAPASITVQKTGLGSGNVTSTPGGIDCGQFCSASFTYRSVVTLKATAVEGSTFNGWGRACAGFENDSTCSLSVDQAESVTANFVAGKKKIRIERTGTGGGTVTSTPAGLTCISYCWGDFDFASYVTITAKPNGASKFAGWGGECTNSGQSCRLYMNGDKSLSVKFIPKPVRPPKPKPNQNQIRVCGLLPGSGAYGYTKTRGITCARGARIAAKARKRFCRTRNKCRTGPPYPMSKTYRGSTFVARWRCRVMVKYEQSSVRCTRGVKFVLRAGGS